MNDSPRATHTFFIPGLDCPEEYALIARGLTGIPGVGDTRPDYLSRTLRVEFNTAAVDIPAIESRLRDIGFPSQPAPSPRRTAGPPAASPHPVRRLTLLAGLLLIVAGGLSLGQAPPHWVVAALIAATLAAGWHVAGAAWRAIRLRSVDMNVLMTIAAAGAISTGDFAEAATAMFLFAVSLWLESRTLAQARRAVQSLVSLRPAVAHRLCQHGGDSTSLCGNRSPSLLGEGREDASLRIGSTSHGAGNRPAAHVHVVDIDPQEIQIQDLLLVRPGERIPADGTIVSGSSLVNESPLTGESTLLEKEAGSSVYAGSLNGEGTLEIRATTTADQSTLAHIARLVEQAQSARSPTERLVDRFARRYTPLVVAAAVLLAVGPTVLAWSGVGWAAAVPADEWLHRALVLLVIACPCAFVISIPVTILCGLHQATRLGLLVKGGEYLEWAGKLRCIAFDKTGTLTEGQPRLVEVRGVGGTDADTVLRMAAALESASEHPLGQAIVAAARQRGLAAERAQVAITARGAGIEGEVDGRTCFVGSVRHALQRTGLAALPPELSGEPPGTTLAVVGCERRLMGAIYLADELRHDARAAIAELRRLNIRHVAMLTGDAQPTASRIAAEAGIERVFAELMPQDKVRVVEQLVAEHDGVAMVGDGVNDAPALAAARLGIALGTLASDTALETADVVSISPHLRRIPAFVRLGRRTRVILTQNIAFALAIKLAVLLLALAGFGTLWAAVAADVGASMLVVFNGMRLLSRVDVTASPA